MKLLSVVTLERRKRRNYTLICTRFSVGAKEYQSRNILLAFVFFERVHASHDAFVLAGRVRRTSDYLRSHVWPIAPNLLLLHSIYRYVYVCTFLRTSCTHRTCSSVDVLRLDLPQNTHLLVTRSLPTSVLRIQIINLRLFSMQLTWRRTRRPDTPLMLIHTWRIPRLERFLTSQLLIIPR